jgi:hypothetical protein
VVGVVLGLVLGATSPGSPAPRPVAHPSVNPPRHAHARIAERAPALVGLVPPPLLPAVSAPRPQAHPTARPTAPRTAPSAKTTAQPAEAGSTATQLEAVGHSLLEQGQYSAAITVLQHAMAATGEGTGTCVEPRGPDCLTYAFALYDLGRALRLGGNPAAAVPILERRMRIKNHRKIVASELRLARRGSD